MTQNQINYQSLQESKRSNLAKEAETNRSNLAREAETYRSNRATEQLTASRDAESARANKAREAETNRSNLAQEMLKAEQNQVSRYAADRSYDSRVDSAYINKYGLSKSDALDAASAVSGAMPKIAPAIKNAVNTGSKIADAAAKTGLAATMTVLKAPQVAAAVPVYATKQTIQKVRKQ